MNKKSQHVLVILSLTMVAEVFCPASLEHYLNFTLIILGGAFIAYKITLTVINFAFEELYGEQAEEHVLLDDETDYF
jgi:hypothetical protein